MFTLDEYLEVTIKVLVVPSLASSAEILQRTVKGWLIQNRPFGRHRWSLLRISWRLGVILRVCQMSLDAGQLSWAPRRGINLAYCRSLQCSCLNSHHNKWISSAYSQWNLESNWSHPKLDNHMWSDESVTLGEIWITLQTPLSPLTSFPLPLKKV